MSCTLCGGESYEGGDFFGMVGPADMGDSYYGHVCKPDKATFAFFGGQRSHATFTFFHGRREYIFVNNFVVWNRLIADLILS